MFEFIGWIISFIGNIVELFYDIDFKLFRGKAKYRSVSMFVNVVEFEQGELEVFLMNQSIIVRVVFYEVSGFIKIFWIGLGRNSSIFFFIWMVSVFSVGGKIVGSGRVFYKVYLVIIQIDQRISILDFFESFLKGDFFIFFILQEIEVQKNQLFRFIINFKVIKVMLWVCIWVTQLLEQRLSS